MKSIKLIGVGGIGTNLLFFLCRHLNFRGSDTDIQGNSKLVLIDGDEFEPKNAERQDFVITGNKAKVKAEELAIKFKNISFRAVAEFITKDNISDLIDDGDVVFMAVDNHATRKLVSDYCRTLTDVTLISGGNELTDGNVQAYQRENGKDILRPITDFHPEIQKPADRSPGEMSCEERARTTGAKQILVSNVAAAWLMYLAFWLLEQGKINQLGEFYFDLLEDTKVQKQERRPNEQA